MRWALKLPVAADGHRLQLAQLLLQAIGHHAQLLAQTGGRGGLSVGLGQHGHVVPGLGVLVEPVYHLLQLRDGLLAQRVLHAHGH